MVGKGGPPTGCKIANAGILPDNRVTSGWIFEVVYTHGFVRLDTECGDEIISSCETAEAIRFAVYIHTYVYIHT